ncbi:MAG: ACP phosphodiesterase, partial [Bacteroidota bacterium]|nr:ACP phosphodiesterase [Bacteroidota bacterium]
CGALTAFAGSHEAVLAAHRENMPERSRRFFDAMVSQGWLVGYRDPDTVEAVLLAMSQRRKTAGPVARGWEAFLKDEETLRGLGCDLVQHMERWGKEVNLVSLVPQHL